MAEFPKAQIKPRQERTVSFEMAAEPLIQEATVQDLDELFDLINAAYSIEVNLNCLYSCI